MKKILSSVLLLISFYYSYAQFCDYPIGYGENTTGGQGGDEYVVTTLDDSGTGSLREALESTSPLIISFAVSGTILLDTDIELKSNKTVDAGNVYIRIRYCAFLIDGGNNIIVRNLHFDSNGEDHGETGDAISISEASENIWIDHCSFEDYYDGLVDIKRESDYITVSWCYFRGHNKVMLIGHDEDHTADIGHLHVTVHHCWFDETTQRHPRLRFGKVHCYNNWYYKNGLYGIVAQMDGQIYVERCRFEDISTGYLAEYEWDDSQDGHIDGHGNDIIGGGSLSINGGVFDPDDEYDFDPDNANENWHDRMVAYCGYGTTEDLSLEVDGNTMTAPFGKSYQWYLNGDQITDAISQSYTGYECGEYRVKVKGDNGCAINFYHTFYPFPPVPEITVNGNTLTSGAASGNQWYLNGNIIPGADQQSYVAVQSGLYHVIVTDGNGCSTTSDTVNIIVTTISGNNTDRDIKVFPNPFDNTFNIVTGKNNEVQVEIYDIVGKKIITKTFDDSKSIIDMRDYNDGIYLLKIIYYDRIIIKKIIKKQN